MIRGKRWQQVKQLLDEALERPSDKRRAFVEEVCAGDELLRREVESFLEEEQQAGEFLVRPVFSLTGDEDREPGTGQRIGPYLLIRRLGSGGMGTVYLAERADGELEQKVAIKLLKRGMDTDEIVRRFHAERQILADLSHTYVARFLDAGTSEDGLPYFVMEYVAGVSITDYCDAHVLSVADRLELFRKVCSAVGFAHQNLVVHRDLKPANILVTAEGTPKLLDFGIAKLLDEPHSFTTVSASGIGPMTPHCASPEQVRGGLITTATDVYALGVLLYELLTGHCPYRLDKRHPDQVARAVCEEIPPKPSTAVSPKSLRRQLTGDLDNIVLKAIRKEPQRRFSSAEQLSEDLRRHLEGRPVHSRSDTLFYRTGKFVRRNRFQVAAAVIMTLSLLGFATVLAFQRSQVLRERDRAEEVTEFLVDFLSTSDPRRSKGASRTVREALDDGVGRLDGEPDLDPLIRATLLDAAGRVYGSLALDQEARLYLQEALALRLESLGKQHVLVATSLQNLASVERRLGQREQAENLMRRAIEIQRKRFPEGDRGLARGLNNLASLLIGNGALEEAEDLALEALEMKKRLFGEEHSEIAYSLNTLATLYTKQRAFEKAESLYRESIRLRRKFDGPVDPGLAKALNNLGHLLCDRGRLQAARRLHEEALEMRRQVFDGDHPDVVTSLSNFALTLIPLGEVDEAVRHLEEGIAMQRRLSGDRSPHMAVLKRNLAHARAEMGQPALCEELAEGALVILRETGAEEVRIADAQSVRAGCLADLGRFEEAEPILLQSYETLVAISGQQDRKVREARRRIVATYRARSRHDEAARYLH